MLGAEELRGTMLGQEGHELARAGDGSSCGGGLAPVRAGPSPTGRKERGLCRRDILSQNQTRRSVMYVRTNSASLFVRYTIPSMMPTSPVKNPPNPRVNRVTSSMITPCVV